MPTEPWRRSERSELRLVSIFKENIGLNFRPPRMRFNINLSFSIRVWDCYSSFWVELMFVGVGPRNTPLENDLPLWVHVSHWFHCQSCAKQVSTRRFVQLQTFHCLWIISMEYHGFANASWIDDKPRIVDNKKTALSKEMKTECDILAENDHPFILRLGEWTLGHFSYSKLWESAGYLDLTGRPHGSKVTVLSPHFWGQDSVGEPSQPSCVDGSWQFISDLL